jgi:anti-sigma B factor antagonist
MILTTERDGDTATVIVGGIVDMRGAADLETALTALLNQRGAKVIVDFAAVELLTSAGIRVLVTITRRLTAIGGVLALCALNSSVQRVLDVSGLTKQFKTAPTRSAARTLLAAEAGRPQLSTLAQLLDRLIGGDDAGAANAAVPAAQRAAVAAALEQLVVHSPRGCSL